MLRFHKAFLYSTHTKSQVNLHHKNARFVLIFSQPVNFFLELYQNTNGSMSVFKNFIQAQYIPSISVEIISGTL